MFEGLDLSSPNILLSGGADGADSAFSKAASAVKHQVVHWTFEGHKSKLRKGLYQLTDEHLTAVDPYLVRANKGLIRSFPTKSEHTNNLLRRNHFQVRWSESVYAISKFSPDSSMLKVAGGTAWACQLYVDRFIYDQEPMSLCKLYLFDQGSERWYQWDKVWYKMDQLPPTPFGVYAGIGSRDLTTAGLDAINSLYKV
jgi:hypothetical protein